MKKSMLSNLKIAQLVLTAALLPGLSACTDSEVAIGVGATALAAGAIAIGVAASNSGHRHHSPPPRYNNHYRSRHRAIANVTDSVESAVIAGVKTADWANTFGLSLEGSEKLLIALDKAQQGDLQAVTDLGLTRDDVVSLAKLEVPSAAGVEALASNLNSPVENTMAMLEDLTDIAKTELKEKNSAQANE